MEKPGSFYGSLESLFSSFG